VHHPPNFIFMSKKDTQKTDKSIAEQIQRQFIEERKLFFWGQVTDKSCCDIAQKALYLDMLNPHQEIKLYINSPGGSVTAGLALFDTLKLLQSPISTIVMGMAASMGSILLCAGQKGRRFLFPHAQVLIHQPLIMGKIVAPAVDLSIHAQEMEKQRQQLNLILAQASGQPIHRVQEDTDRDYYMNAQEAIDYGLADQIITDLNI